MIINKKKRYFYFFIFIIPALFCYCLFFIYPFLKGIEYSFTDWNGIVPEIPVSFEKDDFENNIIPKIKEKNAEFLKEYYKLDENDLYRRRQLSRRVTNKIKGILKTVGITPIKFVGLKNFKDMFNSKIDQRFLPNVNVNYIFKENNELPFTIESSVYNNLLLKRIKNEKELKVLQEAYSQRDDENYLLKEGVDEFELFDRIDVIENIDFDEVDNAVENIKDAAFKNDNQEKNKIISQLKTLNKINDNDKEELKDVLEKYYFIFSVKKVLSKYMYKKEFNLGVVGFSLFCTFFNVIFANLAALLLALALDRNLKSRNILRSVFFLPNILSLIIVAFVWSFIFNRILPSVTGIEIWLSNPELAPYLVVFVGVWQGCGYLMIIYLAGLQSIPKEILEVASIDGSRGIQKFFSITLPLLFPAFTICIFWSLANSLKTFDIIFALVGNSSYVTNTTPIVLDIYFDAFSRNQFGYATAKALLLCLIILFLTSIQLFIMKRKEVEL